MQRLPIFLLLVLLAACAPAHFAAHTLNQPALSRHRTVAILPFEVEQNRLRLRDIRYAGPDTTRATQQRIKQEWTARQQQESRLLAYRLQELLGAQLQAQPPARGYTVQFQAVAETNRRLQQAGITYHNLLDQPMSELQRVLGVDAVLSGQTLLSQPLPGGVELAVRILLNEPVWADQNTMSTIPASQATTNLTLHDCRSGQLVWRFDFERRGNAALQPERLAQDLLCAAAPSFPYRR